MPFTLFYDGYCPLCVAEMRELQKYDHQHKLQLVDIQQPSFKEDWPHIDPDKARSILHAYDESGQLLLGLDVTWGAWQRVNKKTWIRVLRWPVIRWFADRAYLFFARNRYSISWLLTGKRTCQSCSIDSPDSCKPK